MIPVRSALPVLFAALAVLAAPGQAQEPTTVAEKLLGGRGEATIYRDVNFAGPAVTVSRANPDMRLSWRVTSIRVRSGAWQLCSQPNYRGTCITVDRDDRNLRGQLSTVASLRPVSWDSGGGSNTPDRSLRGMAAEFFTAPRDRNQRVLACPNGSATAACAARSAERFCKSRGWSRSSRQAMQTENRRVYLADVLCSNTGM